MVGHLGFSETVLADDLVVRNGIFYKKFTDVPFIGDVIGHQNGTIINGNCLLYTSPSPRDPE